ncbi:MAG TPA: LuxR C-terminal-related transcriptional regulator [Actinomycetota bacterium]
MRRSLTERELAILRLISDGHTSGEISQALGVSRRTVEYQKRQIFAKLGVRSQAHAVALAARAGLLRPGTPVAESPGQSQQSREEGRAPRRHPVVLGRPSPVLARLACILVRCELPEPPEPPVAVLVDPEPGDWQAAAELGARIVLVPERDLDPAMAVEALLRGADAVVSATQESRKLVATVELVGAGQVVLDPLQARMLVDAARGQLEAHGRGGEAPAPTRREREIFASIDRGESVKQTARALGISVKTVENLQRRLFRKLGVRNRAQAVAAAHARGLLCR